MNDIKTDIEKQENIVTILYEFIDNMIIDNAYKDYQKGYSTHGIREAVGTALDKILKLDGLTKKTNKFYNGSTIEGIEK